LPVPISNINGTSSNEALGQFSRVHDLSGY
jgi:hypothetical protein